MPIENKPDVEMRDIPGYEGLYMITRDGRVWSYPKTRITHLGGRYILKSKWLKNTISLPSKVVIITLCKNSIHKTIVIAKVVAIIYLPNPENKRRVAHIDGNLFNNNLDNLEWTW